MSDLNIGQAVNKDEQMVNLNIPLPVPVAPCPSPRPMLIIAGEAFSFLGRPNQSTTEYDAALFLALVHPAASRRLSERKRARLLGHVPQDDVQDEEHASHEQLCDPATWLVVILNKYSKGIFIT
jgi:hypothetical protein